MKTKGMLVSLAILAAAAAAPAVMHVRHVREVLRYPYPLEYTEGVTAHWSMRSLAGGPLYPPVDENAPVHNPYPPGFYRILRAVSAAFPEGHAFLGPRLMALSGMIWATLAVGLIAARWGLLPALCGMALFGLSELAMRYGVMARIDMTALAFSVTSVGALTFVGGPVGALLGGAAAGAALAIKPTFAAAAAAALCVASLRGRGSLAAAVCGMVPVAAGLSFMASDAWPGAVTHLWALNRLPLEAGGWWRTVRALPAGYPLLCGALAIFLAEREHRFKPSWWYAFWVLPGLVAAAKTGADANYLLEALAAGALAGAAVVRSMAGRGAGAAAVAALAVAVQLLMSLPAPPAPVFSRTYEQELTGGGVRMTPDAEDVKAGRAIVDELRRANRILSQSPGFVLAAGRPLLFQPYQFTQLAAAGVWDDGALVDRLRRGEFDLVMLAADKERRADYLTPAMTEAIESAYVSTRHIGPFLFLKPLRPQPDLNERDLNERLQRRRVPVMIQ